MLKVIREFRKKRSRLKWFWLIPRSYFVPYYFFLLVFGSIGIYCMVFFAHFLSYAVFKDFNLTFDHAFLSKEHLLGIFTSILEIFWMPTFFFVLILISDLGVGTNSRGIYAVGTHGIFCKMDVVIFPWKEFKSIRVGNPDFLFRKVRRVFFYFDKSKAKNITFLDRYVIGKTRISVEEKDLPELLSEIKKYAPESLHPPEVLELQSDN